jgi:hypothetical protein
LRSLLRSATDDAVPVGRASVPKELVGPAPEHTVRRIVRRSSKAALDLLAGLLQLAGHESLGGQLATPVCSLQRRGTVCRQKLGVVIRSPPTGSRAVRLSPVGNEGWMVPGKGRGASPHPAQQT